MNWQDPISGKIYPANAKALIGRGTPPTVPLDCGCGNYPMIPTDKKPTATPEDCDCVMPGPPIPAFVRGRRS